MSQHFLLSACARTLSLASVMRMTDEEAEATFMTGQILAGMDPLEAAKYQILLIFLLSGGAGLAAVVVVYLAAIRLTDDRRRLRIDRLTAKG